MSSTPAARSRTSGLIPIGSRVRPLLLALAVACSVVPALHAQSTAGRSVLVIRVKDEDGNALPHARVSVAGVARPASTDARGQALVPGLAAGTRAVQVAREGYASRRIDASLAAGDTLRLEVRLAADPVELERITASAARHAPHHSVLEVHVSDEQGKPLPRAYVTVGGTEYGASTDAHGVARVYGIGEGNRLIQVSRQGYAFGRAAADFTGRDTVRRDLRLTPQAVELEGITATSWGRSMRLRQNGFYQRMRAGWGAFMTRDRIDQLQPYHTSDLFRYLRGYTVMMTGRGTEQQVVATRGAVSFSSRACIPLVWVDGMLVSNNVGYGSAVDIVPPQDVEAIEAYAGISTIPAEYNPTGSACGVVVIWTRNGS